MDLQYSTKKGICMYTQSRNKVCLKNTKEQINLWQDTSPWLESFRKLLSFIWTAMQTMNINKTKYLDFVKKTHCASHIDM